MQFSICRQRAQNLDDRMSLWLHKSGKRQAGFTILEAVITISIMGILAAVVTPTYMDMQNEAKLTVSEANVSQIKQAFINLYLKGLFESNLNVWPDEPAGNEMTEAWAASTVLFDGRTVNQLFQSSEIIYNPYGNPFLYYKLAATDTEEAGIRIEDPDTGISQSFRP
jgi:prepilin-type N-terminal cleavage/methylation domain-containing protein